MKEKTKAVSLLECVCNGFYTSTVSSQLYNIAYATISKDKKEAHIEFSDGQAMTYDLSSTDPRTTSTLATFLKKVDPDKYLQSLPESEKDIRDFMRRKLEELAQ